MRRKDEGSRAGVNCGQEEGGRVTEEHTMGKKGKEEQYLIVEGWKQSHF